MSSLSDALSVAALLLPFGVGIALRGKVLGRRRTLAAAERLLRAKGPNGDRGWSMDQWDWAFKEVRTAKALQKEAARSTGRPA